MKFNEFKYERLDYQAVENEFKPLLEKLKQAENPSDFMEVFKQINTLRNHIGTMSTLASVRHTIDTSDKFYEAENDYWDEVTPKLSVLYNEFYAIVLKCSFKEKLDIPETFFKLADIALKSFDPKIIEDLQLENKLSSEYGKLKASAKIELDGKIYNLSTISPLANDANRETRKKVYQAVSNFYKENEAEFDRIYDELVKVRHQMATKLGYKNYVELGYLRMARLDYDENMVANFRKQVLENIVPISTKIYEAQAKRLGLDKLLAYDKNYIFKTGNPTPKGDEAKLLAVAKKMYSEMSKETEDFFNLMLEKELFDLSSKDNKKIGGYCTEFADYKVPFIFANLNGTAHDVDVLTHEAGHAFQSYLTALNNDIPECMFPTMETAEIHSMSMEFFAHPWMEGFFKEDTTKYYYSHIAGALQFLPYGVLVDHYQHEVYNHPEMTPDMRKACWRKLEKQYLPTLDYGDDHFMDKGTFWYRQGHIYESPFYYIDYCIAQICALQFFNRMLIKDPKVWEDYLVLCKNGGTKTFLENIKAANIDSPFNDGTIEKIVGNIEKELNKYDVSKF